MPALQFLIVSLNRLQASFEYEFLPADVADGEDRLDPFLTSLRDDALVSRERLRGEIPAFVVRLHAFLRAANEEYRLKEDPPRHFVIVTLARFDDDWISMRAPGLAVIALGNWKRAMAPPSILEFILTLIVRESVASACPALRGSVHLGTKGCVCDFTADLQETRIKALAGFLCDHCRRALDAHGGAQVSADVTTMLAKAWLGKTSDPSAPAGIIANLGHDLFLTKGVSPSRWERLVAGLQEEGFKELVKLAGAVILAGLLLWLGWRKT